MNEYVRLKRIITLLVAIWTILIVASLEWNYLNEKEATVELATNEVKTSFKKLMPFVTGLQHMAVFMWL